MRQLSFCLLALVVIASAFNTKHSGSSGSLTQSFTDTVPGAEPIVFTKAEVEPQFPGGESEWKIFLGKNINSTVPVHNGAPAGQYTAQLQFIVEKDGSISDIKALTKNGYGIEEESIRLMKLSPKWQPAKQNGHIVRCYKKQPITFVISEG